MDNMSTGDDISQTKRSFLKFHAENLKHTIRSGDSTLRLIDIFTAEEVIRQLGTTNELTSSLAFDITLALSYAGSQGHVALTVEDFERYEECFYSFRQLALRTELGAAENSWLSGEEPIDGENKEKASLYKHLFEEHSALLITELETLGLTAPITHERTLEQGRWSLRRFKHLQCQVDQFVSSGLTRDKYTEMGDSIKQVMRGYVAQLFEHNLSSTANFDAEAGAVCENQLDRQALAAAQSLLSRLVFVSGGPGTGKTTTAARMLVLNLLQAHLQATETHSSDEKHANLGREISALCLAPTGKAAQRLAASLRAQVFKILDVLSLEESLRQQLLNGLPSEGLTMHRYLIDQGAPMDELYAYDRRSDNQRVFGDGGPCVKHSPSIVIVDESSMIDLALMQRFVSTVSDDTTLVFLGDHFQLPPVEAGEVFAGWVNGYSRCGYSSQQLSALADLLSIDEALLAPLNAHQGGVNSKSSRAPSASHGSARSEVQFNPVVQLLKTYRFSGALGEFARLIRDADYQDISSFLAQSVVSDVSVSWIDLTNGSQALASSVADVSTAELYNELTGAYAAYAEALREQSPLPVLHACFEKFQVLCSTRKGPLGTEAINAHLEQALMSLISRHRDSHSRDTSAYIVQGKASTGDKVYHGKPILIESNYPHLDVYNGDVGFVIDDNASLSTEGMSSEGSLNRGRRYAIQFYRGDDQAPVSVPYHKISGYSLAYAMTVHKSQGSEYQNVSVVIAPYASEMLSRSLLYTAITRSRSQVHVYVSKSSLQQSLGVARH